MPADIESRGTQLRITPHFGKHRYGTDGTGIPMAKWKILDSFLAQEGPIGVTIGGVVYMFSSCERSKAGAENYLVNMGYTQFIAAGVINHQSRIWQFTDPDDVRICESVLRRFAGESEFLRYYGEFNVNGPSGEGLGLIQSHYCTL